MQYSTKLTCTVQVIISIETEDSERETKYRHYRNDLCVIVTRHMQPHAFLPSHKQTKRFSLWFQTNQTERERERAIDPLKCGALNCLHVPVLVAFVREQMSDSREFIDTEYSKF